MPRVTTDLGNPLQQLDIFYGKGLESQAERQTHGEVRLAIEPAFQPHFP